MAKVRSTGTCLSVCAGLPATYDATGFGNLVFTQVGELESIGGTEITRNTGTFTNLCNGNTSTIKGARAAITVAVVCALDQDDAGQTIMIASEAEESDLYSFCITLANGSKDYFVGTVVRVGKTFGGDTDPVKAPYDIAIDAVPQMAKPILSVAASNAPTGVTVSPSPATVAASATVQLSATVSPVGATQTVSWSSANPSIATVDSSGQVTGVSVGVATIVAVSTVDATKIGTASVTVTA